jgi:hypothetical protein
VNHCNGLVFFYLKSPSSNPQTFKDMHRKQQFVKSFNIPLKDPNIQEMIIPEASKLGLTITRLSKSRPQSRLKPIVG